MERLEQINDKVALHIAPTIKEASRRIFILNIMFWLNLVLTVTLLSVFIFWVIIYG